MITAPHPSPSDLMMMAESPPASRHRPGLPVHPHFALRLDALQTRLTAIGTRTTFGLQ
jgi:hypothetical protein|eukprot:COSAG01_NODE_4815_length_4725_cov_2.012970_5_plen_58_part_00